MVKSERKRRSVKVEGYDVKAHNVVAYSVGPHVRTYKVKAHVRTTNVKKK